MIIDALTHVHPDPRAYGPEHDLSLDNLIANVDASPVDRAVVTAIASDTRYGTDTEFVAECCRTYPEKLIGFCSVDPLRDSGALEKLERYAGDMHMRGLKLHPRHQRFSPADPGIVPVVVRAAELGLPVAICGSQWKHAPLEHQLPMNIDALCKRVPQAKIIICHSGGFKFMDAFVVAVANENVYLETSISLNYFAGTPFEEQFMFTLKKIGAHRVVYGSDHPEFPLKACYAKSVEIFDRHGFSESDRAKIFGENILSLLPD